MAGWGAGKPGGRKAPRPRPAVPLRELLLPYYLQMFVKTPLSRSVYRLALGGEISIK